MSTGTAAEAVSFGNYNSGAIKLGIEGQQPYAGGAVFNGSQLLHFFRWKGNLQYIAVTPPSGTQYAQDPWMYVLPDNWGCWKRTDTGISVDYTGTPMQVVGVPSATVEGQQDVYIFTGQSGKCVVYLMSAQDPTNLISYPLMDLNGIASLPSCVGATAFLCPGGSNYLLVAYISNSVLVWDAFDLGNLPAQGSAWQASCQAWGDTGQFQLPDGSLMSGSLGPVVSMDWYSTDANDFYLVISYASTDLSNGYVMVANIDISQGPVPTMSKGYYQVQAIAQAYPGPVVVARDAAGRMLLGGAMNDTGYFAIVGINEVPSTEWPMISSADAWVYGYSVGQQPVTTWATGAPYSYSYTLPGGKTITTSRVDVFQITFLADSESGDNIWCLVTAFGIAEQMPNAVSGSLLPEVPCESGGKTYYGAIAGIIDAPFPMPASNAVSAKKGSGATLATVTYGNTESYDEQRAVDWAKGGGASVSETTTAGFGYNFAMSSQYMNITNNGWDSSSTMIDTNPLQTNVDQAGAGIVNQGVAFGSNVNYIGTSYVMLSSDGSARLPGSAVTCNWTAVLQEQMAPNPFTPYLVTAGYLDSYGESQIDATAQALGLGAGYVENVIRQNALEFADGSNCLSGTATITSPAVTGFLSSDDSWTETGWSFTLSIYAGFGGGFSLSAGFGGASVTTVGVQFSVMGGFNLSGSHEVTDTQSEQIQIQIQAQLPENVNAFDVLSMSFEVYFLPGGSQASSQFMQELAAHSGLTFQDANSQPWRIFFLVTAYTLTNRTTGPAPAYQSNTPYSEGQTIYDGQCIQQCTGAGTTGDSTPTWNDTLNGTTSDGTVTWTCLGPKPHDWRSWEGGTYYALGDSLSDGKCVQLCTTAGTSGDSTPTWNETQYGTTNDGSVVWTCKGPMPS